MNTATLQLVELTDNEMVQIDGGVEPTTTVAIGAATLGATVAVCFIGAAIVGYAAYKYFSN